MEQELDIKKLAAWQRAGRHDEVLEEIFFQLKGLPDNCDLLAVAAVSLRCLGRVDEALKIHERIGALRPRFSLMLHERALCHLSRGAIAEAIEALTQAVLTNPAMPASWKLLEELYLQSGEQAKAAAASAQLVALRAMPGPVMIASAMVADGHYAPAEQMLGEFLQQHDDQPDALLLLARIAAKRGAFEDAQSLAERALRLAPDSRNARRDYADMLIQQHKYSEAGEQASRLLALDPSNPDYILLAAAIAIGIGKEREALSLYRALLAEKPGRADAYLWLGHALMMTSQADLAVTAYRRAAILRPDFGDAYWSLANLKRYRFTDEELARMRIWQAASTTMTTDRYHLCFALGKGLEDRREFAESWHYYKQGNTLKGEKLSYRPESVEINTARQIGICTQSFFARRKGWGDSAGDPIFIVGLPRSGSTLIEQILASHSQVEGTQELAEIEHIAFELQGPEHDALNPLYPAAFAGMNETDFALLGARYLRDTGVHRSNKPFFIDKMPNNFKHIGLIHLMLPNARIIDVRREPMACCFSNFKQLFASGQEFSYRIEDMARYYRTYLELMRHWDEVLPGRVLRVHYEDVVENIEAAIHRILDYCGLPFEMNCLEFYKTERNVRTPSSEQVRQPIFRDGLDQWRNYSPWLGTLRETLGDALILYRDGKRAAGTQRPADVTALRAASNSSELYQPRRFST